MSRLAIGEAQPAPRRGWRKTAWVVFVLAAITLLLHFLFNREYGFFRDELYYMACGHHLAWGYVDQPPLVAVVARVSEWLMGSHLFAIRFFPALAGAAVVFLTGKMAGELGGGKFAQGLAALAMLAAPAYLAFDNFLSMNAFEPIFWTLCALIALRIARGADERWWLLFGVVAGVGLLNKNSMLIFGYAIFVGLLLSPARRVFYSKWIWIAALVTFAIFAPNLAWQWRHGWPQIQVVMNARLYKNVPVSPLGFLFDQVLFMHPVTLPVWAAGLWWYFTEVRERPERFLGVTWLVLLAVFVLLHSKSYYLLPAYPLLLSAGGVAWERWLASERWRRARVALPAAIALGGLITLPYGLPILPIRDFLRYEKILPMSGDIRVERDADGPLPQLYADMFSWRHTTRVVAGVYNALPPARRSGCAIVAWNYGEAGAIDHYGKRYGLPQALSGHNNFYFWGPGDYSGSCVVAVGVPLSLLDEMFTSVHLKARVLNPHAMAVENHLPIYLCGKPKAPFDKMWPKLRYYI